MTSAVAVQAKTFVAVDPVHLLPTGKIGTVAAADFLDFTKPKSLGKDIDRGNVSPKGGPPPPPPAAAAATDAATDGAGSVPAPLRTPPTAFRHRCGRRRQRSGTAAAAAAAAAAFHLPQPCR